MSTIHQILKQYWGYDQFRPLQEEIILDVIHKKDTLALLPTGGGKSICFQVPALAMQGICIVVSPLIALMKDQKDNLVKRGIRAEAIYSGMSFRQIDIILDNCIYGDVKFLYISPERLQTPLFKARFEKMNVSFVAVDEAHCISQWGYDFRPEYLEIYKLRELNPDIHFLAVTATATEEVAHDVCSKLQFKNHQIYKSSFERANLSFVVRKTEDKYEQLINILQKTKGTGIVYANSRNEVKNISTILQRNHIQADYYHAGLSSKERVEKQQAWIENKIRVIVSTNAFGMGIDKSDVRIVIHQQMPLTPEAYYQEAGRAGRDGKKCYAVILHHTIDDEQTMARVNEKFPQFSLVRDMYDKLCNFLSIPLDEGEFESHMFDIGLFCENFKQSSREVLASISMLESHGYLRKNDGLNEPSKLLILLNQTEIYKLQVASPQYETLLGLLLRMYGSLFDNHVYIKEEDIARKLKTTVLKVHQMLMQLHKIQAVEYIPRKAGPQIEFLKPRIKKNELLFDAAKIKILYDTALNRVHTMIGYIHEEHVCRSKYLRNYFDDNKAEPCGICDICMAKRKEIINSDAFQSIKEYIFALLAVSPQSIKILLKNHPKFKEEELAQGIKWLLDTEEIYEEHGLYKLTTEEKNKL